MLSKKIKYRYIAWGLCISGIFASCDKSLDINDNPNEATESTPELVLPQAIVRTAQIVPTFNTYGARIMYVANSGGVSGWGGGFLDYDYSTGNEAGLWANTYDNLTDYEYVIKNTQGVEGSESFYHAAWIFKAYNFANLVDTYNDIPYTEALQGSAIIHPKYDKAEDIYADLVAHLDEAVTYFKTADLTGAFETSDVVFDGDEEQWAKFANTLKLKLVLKGQGKVSFSNASIDAIGVLDDDAIVNPVFTKIDGKQNPMWNLWAYNAGGTAVGTWGTQYIPTPFVMGFYDGYKLDDEERADVTFGNGIDAPQNQLGDESVSSSTRGLSPSTWTLRPISGTISATNYRGIGIIKGPSAGQPVMLAAEAQLLAAEAVVKGIMTGNAKTHFEDGIKASYAYLNKDESDEVEAGVDVDAYLADYISNNASSKLVNFDLATTDEEKMEAIITQKYIAFNFLFSHEGWNEYRRTGYPSIIDPATNKPYPNNTANAQNTFVSIQSKATAEDKLPTRILYPNTEFQYNEANIPSVDKFTSKIFWAK